VSSRSRCNPRGLKRKMSAYPLRPRGRSHIRRVEIESHIKIVKQRWQVELLFKWIKGYLRIKFFYGTSANAVKTQV